MAYLWTNVFHTKIAGHIEIFSEKVSSNLSERFRSFLWARYKLFSKNLGFWQLWLRGVKFFNTTFKSTLGGQAAQDLFYVSTLKNAPIGQQVVQKFISLHKKMTNMLSLQNGASDKLFSLQRPPLLGGILGGLWRKKSLSGLSLRRYGTPSE